MTSLPEYVSGGYFVVQTIVRPEGLSETLPRNLLTMSNCFTDVMRDIVRLKWDNYEDVGEGIAEEAASFCIDQSRIPELVTWAKSQRSPNCTVFSEVKLALEVKERFISDSAVAMIRIGLHTSLLKTFDDQLSQNIWTGADL